MSVAKIANMEAAKKELLILAVSRPQVLPKSAAYVLQKATLLFPVEWSEWYF